MFNHLRRSSSITVSSQPSYFTNFCAFEDPFGQRVKIFLHRSVAIERIPDLAKASTLIFNNSVCFTFSSGVNRSSWQ